jgi:dihydroorotate dehydrogenase (fumarate)
MQEAGADAIELNIYYIPTSFELTSQEVEKTYVDILKAVKSAVAIPVAVKLSPFFSSMANMARSLDNAGADALVLFNRFYQPDIDLEALEVKPNVLLSHSTAMRLPMRWIAILKGRINADLAATSGIHSGKDVIKMLLVGANITQLCSVLLKNGLEYLKQIESEMIHWLTEKEYSSVAQMQGSMSQLKVENPSAFERAQYMKALLSYRF